MGRATGSATSGEGEGVATGAGGVTDADAALHEEAAASISIQDQRVIGKG